jgi:hypothetical protein
MRFHETKVEQELAELREANAEKDKAGSHYCPICAVLHTPTRLEMEKVEYIGRQPQCPKCRGWILEPIARDGSIVDTVW